MLRWAIIGSGDVVNRLVQKSFEKKGISTVDYIYSKDFKTAKILKKKYSYGKVAKNIKKILNDKKINSVYIATPPDSHLFYINIFSKNIKNILCEKPLALSSAEIKKIKKIIYKNNNNFFIPFYRRPQKRFQYIKNLISKGSLGQPVFFRYIMTHNLDDHPTAPIGYKNKKYFIPWRFRKKNSGGGNYIDMGPHALDLVQFLLGKICKISIENSNLKKIYDVEETTCANIVLENKITGQAIWSSIVDKKKDLFEIYFTNGRLKFSLNFKNKLVIEKNNNKKIIFIKLEKPYHKLFIDKMINKILKNKNYIEEEGIEISLLQANSLKPN